MSLGNRLQQITWTRDATGRYLISISTRRGRHWEPLFGSERPIITGSCFDLHPTEARVVQNTRDTKAVLLSGVHTHPDYRWDLLAEARAQTPFIRFRITCHLSADIPLPDPQPSVVLWMTGAPPDVTVDQGPSSIYGSLGIPHCLGFPAAYIWRSGVEAVVFFDMTPATWMSPDGVQRFLNMRVGTQTIHGAAGLGLHCDRLAGHRIRSGDMVLQFHLYAGSRSARPTGLQALDTMVRVCAPLHPATSAYPRDHADGGSVSWSRFARRTMDDLSVPDITVTHLSAPWTDTPLSLVEPSAGMVVHPAQAPPPGQAPGGWDFSTVNNHLSAWALYTRLHPDTRHADLLKRKLEALPRFFDPRAGIIRWGTRQPEHIGDMEMTWQNLFFHIETARAVDAAPPADVNPAACGRFLISARRLADYAHQVDYVFPQWFDPYTHAPLIQNDVKRLGVVREPWQVGSYARVMMKAYGLTGDSFYRNEAAAGMHTLMTAMRYTVTNEVYTRTYTDPVEFPITELFGNAYGAVAAHELFRSTGDSRFLRYSRDFLNTLLRLTFWYEDETGPVNRELRNAGLFYPHGGAHVATPWETTEAHLCLTALLKYDAANPLNELLLKLTNLNRINAFYFYPAACSDAVLGQRQPGIGQYFPFEPFACLEGPGGHRGQTAAYMAGMSMWNDWLYEALAEADDRDIMVLNLDALDGYDAAVSGSQRRFVVYNPLAVPRRVTVRIKHAPSGRYSLQTHPPQAGHAARQSCTDARLAAGIPLRLAAHGHLRLVITRTEPTAADTRLRAQRQAADRLACVYAQLQQAAMRSPADTRWPACSRAFHTAQQACQSGDFPAARRLLRELQSAIR